ncbi:MAG: EI24 domain-containing protein [Pseudobacteriovorax sp.]|nr:EI24 domain-containing protein [Pseudobacteriovorax sp.]
MNPFSRFLRGLRVYWDGIAWLRRHPRYFILLFVPSLVGILAAIGVFSIFSNFSKEVYDYILFTPSDSFFSVLLYNIASAFVTVTMVALSLLLGFLISNIASVPIYDYVSIVIEKDITGQAPQVSLWASIKLIPEEIKKVLAILLISLVMLILPGVNLLAIFVTGFLIGWDFYDYPLARRGWSFKRRFHFVSTDLWAVIGLGLWLTIPFVQLILYPFTVAGGTLLNIERLQREQISA